MHRRLIHFLVFPVLEFGLSFAQLPAADFGGLHDSLLIIPSGEHRLTRNLVVSGEGRLVIEPGTILRFARKRTITVNEGASLFADSACFKSEHFGIDANGGGFIIDGNGSNGEFHRCTFVNIGGRFNGQRDTTQAVHARNGASALLYRCWFWGDADTDDMLKVMTGARLRMTGVHVQRVNHGCGLYVEGPGSLVEIENSIIATGVNHTQNNCIEVRDGAVVRFIGCGNSVIDSKEARIRQRSGGRVICRHVWWGAFPIRHARHLADCEDATCIEWEPALEKAPGTGK